MRSDQFQPSAISLGHDAAGSWIPSLPDEALRRPGGRSAEVGRRNSTEQPASGPGQSGQGRLPAVPAVRVLDPGSRQAT